MVTYEDFAIIYDRWSGEPEFEFRFEGSDEEYMLIKYADHASFQRCGAWDENGNYDGDGSGEYGYTSLDALYHADLIDGIRLDRDWPRITEIVAGSAFYLSLPEHVKELLSK